MQLVLVVAWLRAPVNKSWTTRSQSMHLVNSLTLALSGPHPVFNHQLFSMGWDATFFTSSRSHFVLTDTSFTIVVSDRTLEFGVRKLN